MESAIVPGTPLPAAFAVTVEPAFSGAVQNLLRRADGALANLSTCDAGVTTAPTRITHVQASPPGDSATSSVVASQSVRGKATMEWGNHDGVAVLLSSHLLERVQSVCDRVALFNAGKIALLGTVPELARQVLGGGYNLEVEADGEGLALQFSEIPGVKAVDQAGPSRYRLLADRDVRAPAATVVVKAGGALRRLSIEEPSLDAIYNRYFQNEQMQGAVHANHAA
ncbi:MAG: hypothetical protein WCG92_21950 [Hyphomicrobiales bacterium]